MSAVSLTAASLAVAVLGCSVAGLLGQAARARAEVDAAADLAALAAAASAVRGEPHTVACKVGAAVASAPGTMLTDCEVDGVVVTVRVRLDVAVLGTTVPVVGVARAGPGTGGSPGADR